MPMACMFTLRPMQAHSAPANLARATHAAVLRLIAASSPDLAAQVHDEISLKPMTVSNVLGMANRGPTAQVGPEQDYGLRVTLLTPALEQLAAQWIPEHIGEIDLDGQPWRVEHVTNAPNEHPWAGQSTYEALAAPALLHAANGPTRWELEFAAPVTFRQRGLNMPLPTPDLVFGSLLDKWNAFATLTLPEEVRRFATECLALSRFELRSLAEPAKNGALQIGAVGRCTYTAVNRDRYWLACIEILAHFAFYSGVGAGTTRGFGRARLLAR